MHAILNFAENIILSLLELVKWIVVAYALMSWLVSFNVINLRNRAVWQISRFLESVARPILWPIQRVLPTLGGIDFSPVILFLIIGGVKFYLVPALFGWLHSLVGYGPVV